MVKELDLDHDLGDEGTAPERTGYDVLVWLEEAIVSGKFTHRLPKIYLHTDNPAAKERMKKAIASIHRRTKQE